MRTIFFDATRLFIRGSRFSPTGIDRVVLAYARWLLGLSEVDLRPVVTARGTIWQLPRSLLARIVEGAELFRIAARNESAPSAAWSALRKALQTDDKSSLPGLRARSVVRQLPVRMSWHANMLGRSLWRLRSVGDMNNCVYLNVSHTGLGDSHVLKRLTARGASNVVMVHDLIPIEYPEFCAPGAGERHLRRMNGVVGNTSLVIANSQTTANALSAFAETLLRPCPPIKVALLGIESDFLLPPSSLPVSSPYFVCVGTLEARKNLAFLLTLWRRLAERLEANTPRLVLVGRRGWENEAVLDHLERSQTVATLVHEVSDLQDPELATLISGATALLAPSLAEGFDLPVIEALSLGTPVIASDIPVHRELAGPARLIDPLDGPRWLDAIADAKYERTAPFRAPRWEDHFAALQDDLLNTSGKNV
jgi:glycosyltransferase involved in cell wall biosynthesis